MASVQNHINQWLHNRQFIQSISPVYSDWMVTASFYAALHAVDALLLHDNVRGVTSHDSRNRILSLTNRYKKINSLYYPLYDLSRTIRYIAEPAKWVPYSSIEADVLKRFLYPIESSVKALSGLSAEFSPIVLQKL